MRLGQQPSTRSSYNGEFCYHVHLKAKASPSACFSNAESNVRRATGHGADYCIVGLYPPSGGPAYADNYCYSDGCTADTGHLSQDKWRPGLTVAASRRR